MNEKKKSNKGYVLRLLENLYGLKDTGRTWWEYPEAGLCAQGLEPSKIDPSFYIQDNCICLTFVDDFLIFSKDPEVINELIGSLKKDFSLTDKGDIDKYLGMQVTIKSNGTTKLSQPHLIERIIAEIL